MNCKTRILLRHVQRRIRKPFIQKYGLKYYQDFCRRSIQCLEEILPQIPNIGKSIFKLNYYYIICYFSWFNALKSLGQSPEEAGHSIWFINEAYLKSWPQSLLRLAAGMVYSGTHRRRAADAASEALSGKLHPFDWKIRYQDIDEHTYQLDIYECGALKLACHLGMEDMFPAVCRMDYLFSHYFGNEFRRYGTLADGFECCDSWFRFPGYTHWPPIDEDGKRY